MTRPQALLVGGAAASGLGVVVASTVSQSVGGPLVVLGWLALLYAVHAYGRLGVGAQH